MAAQSGVQFDTGPLKRAIEAASAELQQRVSDQLEAWAGVAARTAAAAAPRRSGKLAGSIKVVPVRALAIQIRAGARHAHFAEFGTVTRFHRRTGKSVGKMPATPYFVANVEAARTRMWAQFEQLFNVRRELV